MRKLASIQKILSIEPIAGADQIVKCTILGWEVVCKKSEAEIGKLGVYCEIDSILPEKPEFEFLRDRKFRIKTIKLKGQISQGIFFPLSYLPNGKYNEGDDVTNLMGITKYETPIERNERQQEEIKASRLKKFMMQYSWYRTLFITPTKTNFPKFIKKTDEDRIQLFPDICEEHKDTVFQVTEKIDGQSATYFIIKNPRKWQFWKPFIFGVCSRNFQLLKADDSSWWTVAKMLNIERKLIDFYKKNNGIELFVQGEIIGPGVQSNKYRISDYDFYAFNIGENNSRKIYDNLEMREVCKTLDLKPVPLLSTDFILKPTIHENVDYAKGESTLHNTLREGVVVRNYAKNVSFKIINPDFLLKYDM